MSRNHSALRCWRKSQWAIISTVPAGRSPFSDTSVRDLSVVELPSGVGEPVREGNLEGTREPTRVGAREGLREAAICEGAFEITCVEDEDTGSLMVSSLLLVDFGEGIEASSRPEVNDEGRSNLSVVTAMLNECDIS